MRRTALLIAAFASQILGSEDVHSTNSVQSDDLGVNVVITPWVKPTEEELFKRKMQQALPYQTESPDYYRLRSLGQLSKICDYVITGKVMTVTPHENAFRENLALSIEVDSVLFGSIPAGNVTVTGYWPGDEWYEISAKANKPYMWNWKKRPKPGATLLMFLIDEASVGQVWKERPFDFRKGKISRKGRYHLLRGNGGIRYLDTPENTKEYVYAATGYLKELRGEKRNVESYYALLRRLIRCPVLSIREDARSDLMYFAQTCPAFDAKRLLSDEKIDEAIKYWAEHELIPSREGLDSKEKKQK